MNEPTGPDISVHSGVPTTASGSEQRAKLTRRLSETAYLDTERTPYYRVIMRYFLERAEAQVTWVKADDVLAHVRSVYDTEYDEIQRDRDLRALTEWRNLLEVQDARGARTARDFRNRRPEYHIRSDALRLERWVREWENTATDGGSLDPSLLERLWHRLSDIYALLLEAERGGDYVLAERAELLWPLWEDAHNYVTALNANTTAFHQSLAEARPTDITDARAFDYYKAVLFQSLTGFINSLAERADRIQSRLAEWERAGLLLRLRDHLVYHRQHRLLGASESTPEAIQTWAEQQIAFVRLWFAPEGPCDGVRRATRQAIATIGRHLGRLAEADAGGHSRAAELRDLACAFAGIADLATAHRLAVATFGAFWLRHYKTSSESAPFTPTASPWQQHAYQVPIKKIRQGRQWTDRDVSGIEDSSERQAALQAASARLRADERALLDAIFAAGRVDLGALNELPPIARDRLLVAIRECLGANDAASLALDGSHIILHQPRHEAAGALRSTDGTLWTPRFQLSRHLPIDLATASPHPDSVTPSAHAPAPVGALAAHATAVGEETTG